MSFEHAQLALALGTRYSVPVRISGVAFRTSHHHAGAAPTLLLRLTQWRKRLVLRRALSNPHVDAFFSSDPTVAPEIKRLVPGVRAVTMPDPVLPSYETQPAALTRRQYGVEEGRRVLLLFGSLAVRKGVVKTLEALERVPDRVARQISVLFVGPIEPDLEGRLETMVAEVNRKTKAQVILRNTFIYEDDIRALMHATDLVLLPYQRHPGTSSVLIRAAGTPRPVLGQAFGNIGMHVRQRALGRVVDTMDPAAIARGMEAFLEHPDEGFDPEQARAFAGEHSVEDYAQTVLATLLDNANQA